MISLPGNKKFAFTIIDDTDDAFLENIKPVYDLLAENNMRTTKTIWVYPPRDTKNSKGDCLMRDVYLDFIKDIYGKGFEIALHNVGSGAYKREEILSGLETFRKLLDFDPAMHINHSYNPDNIYCGSKRFSFPLNFFVKKLYSRYDDFHGEDPKSKFFWGDYHKDLIKYSRNYEIDDINTIKVNPFMPYRDKAYDEYSNWWFSSTFAPNQWVFNKIITPESIDKLEKEGGVCILYTHLGYYMQGGQIDRGFSKMIEYIGGKKTGLYVPVSDLLDILHSQKVENKIPEYIPFIAKKRIELHSLITRIKYRYFIKIDDFHFKKSPEYGK